MMSRALGAPLLGLVHVVDDDVAFRTAIERRLKKAGYEVMTYPSAQHLLNRLPSESELGCILLDVRIPGLNGPELQDRLSELGSTLPIVFLTGHPDVPTTVRTIKAGAQDFLTKPVSSDELLRAIERAIALHEVTRSQNSKLDMVRARIGTLTPRERQVFLLVVRGNTNKHVARALGGTERTIKAHRRKVMEKMQVQSLAELVSVAERVGVFASARDSRPSRSINSFEPLFPIGQWRIQRARHTKDYGMLKPPALRGSTGSQSIAVLEAAWRTAQGHHSCQIEKSSLSSMTTPQCCGV
jgi:FixJ family two-component response regulator